MKMSDIFLNSDKFEVVVWFRKILQFLAAKWHPLMNVGLSAFVSATKLRLSEMVKQGGVVKVLGQKGLTVQLHLCCQTKGKTIEYKWLYTSRVRES